MLLIIITRTGGQWHCCYLPRVILADAVQLVQNVELTCFPALRSNSNDEIEAMSCHT